MDPVTGMMIAQGATQLGGMLMGGYNDRRQLRQQEKLQDLQIKGNQQMLEQLAEKERMMLRESAADQVYGLEKAGLSKSMMMGKGGAGGVTGGAAAAPSGGNADGGAARMMAQTELARAVAEIENIKADTKQKEATTQGTEFENLVNESKTVEEIVKKWGREADMTAMNSEKMMFEFNAWKDATLKSDGQGGHFHDKDSKLTKQLREQYEQTEIALKNAKTNNDIQEFEKTIKSFEAGLTAQGISPNSPWYAKLLMELVKSAGLDPMGWIRKLGGK